FEKFAVQRREEPTFNARRLLELVTFVRPNVESLLRQISRIGFASGQTQTKPVQITVVKFHKIFKLQFGGHLAVIPRWESSTAHLFPPMRTKTNESHDYVGRKVAKNSPSVGNNPDFAASHRHEASLVVANTCPSWIARDYLRRAYEQRGTCCRF